MADDIGRGMVCVAELIAERDALRAEVERLKVAEGEAMLVVESQDVSIANLRAEVAGWHRSSADLLDQIHDLEQVAANLRVEVAVLREQRDHKFEQFLDWRGIDPNPECPKCIAGCLCKGSGTTPDRRAPTASDRAVENIRALCRSTLAADNSGDVSMFAERVLYRIEQEAERG